MPRLADRQLELEDLELAGLRPYQRKGTRFLRSQGRALLADEPGLGKTAQLIRASSGPTLVVAPATIVYSGTWEVELSKWADDPARFTVVPYTSLNSREATPGGGNKPTRHLREEYDREFETVILDEAHYTKGRKTTWTTTCKQLARRADQLFLATGTPIPNWPHELFTALQMLYPDEANPGGRFGSYWRWVDEWFKTVTNRFNPTATDIRGLKGCIPGCKRVPGGHCQHYAAFARANLGRRFLQRLRDDVLTDLPPLTGPIRTECRMGRDQSRMYRELRDELVTETPDGQEMLAWTTSAKTVMLDQLTTGAGVVDLGDGAPPTTKLSAKLDRLEYDLRGRARPTLVVAHYRRSVEAAAQVSRLVGATPAVVHGGIGPLERGRAVRDFQEGRADVLVGSLGTISEGLNLTQADMVIFLEHSYRPSLNQQALRRIHRIGQDRPCVALDYVAVTDRGGRTIDGNKRELLEGKTDEQVRTLSAARLLAS